MDNYKSNIVLELKHELNNIENLDEKIKSLVTNMNNLYVEYTTVQTLLNNHLSKYKSFVIQFENLLKEDKDDKIENPFKNLHGCHTNLFNNPHRSQNTQNSQDHKSYHDNGTINNIIKNNKNITREDILVFIFYILSEASKYNGYAYGSIIRDLIVPYMINGYR